jgi:hypothetical protein
MLLAGVLAGVVRKAIILQGANTCAHLCIDKEPRFMSKRLLVESYYLANKVSCGCRLCIECCQLGAADYSTGRDIILPWRLSHSGSLNFV